MSRVPQKFLLVIAVILSLITSGLIYNYLQKNTQSQAGQGESVVMAARDIPGRTVITPEMVKVVRVPTELVQPGAVRDIGKIKGVMSRIPISAGEQVTERRLALEGKVSGFVGTIPKDKRAYTIAVSEVTGVAGFVKAGDYIDVVVSVNRAGNEEPKSGMLIENVLVLASNRDDNMEASSKDKKHSENVASVTLAVYPDEASLLALAEQRGKIHLALRPFQANQNRLMRKITAQDLTEYSHRDFAPVDKTVPFMLPTAPAAGGVTVIRGTKAEQVPAK